jgi:NAD(P)-dependent dehydrogenase (short-subunit alcohol dehydrogenase family)
MPLILRSLLDLPDLSGRTIVVSGSTSGIGRATAHALSVANARVVLAVRNIAKGNEVAASFPGETLVRELDLAELASVRRFAESFDEPIDILINNAGVSPSSLHRTRDGFEMQFGTNHLGPFALTNLLLQRITGRVVSLSSQAERMGKIDFDDLNVERKPYKEGNVYAASKLANLMFIAELQRRLSKAGSPVTAVAAHPGLVATNMTGQTTGVAALITRLFAQAPEDGALPVLLAATGEVPGGSLTGPERFMHMRSGAEIIGQSKQAQDHQVAARLWDVSEQLTGVNFPL